jgi:hypothetical protein
MEQPRFLRVILEAALDGVLDLEQFPVQARPVT